MLSHRRKLPAMPRPNTVIGLPGGFTVPIPSWTGSFFGVIAVVAIGFGVYRYFFPVVPELVTVKQANEALQREVAHYNMHIVDAPIAALEDDIAHQATGASVGHIALRVFADGCLLISRRVGNAATTRLLLDSELPPKQANTTAAIPSLVATVAAQGRCLNPHPGRFQMAYGAREGCWVQVWRTFEDGCVHVQLFNTCTNVWASNADGSPQVQWTRCLH